MGIFSKMKNYMTGGSAVVSVELSDANLKAPFPVTVKAEIKDDNLNSDKVYLLIRCQEVKKANYVEDNSDMTDNEKILADLDEWIYTTLYKTEMEIAGGGVLKSGEVYSWPVELDLSEAKEPSSVSPGRKIVWELQAGIDVPGNDPDSGWLEFEVS